ncbi:MAG: hypothetical protein IPP79_20625 [Chitinophagaceae bacterium]|nr:hypothetical protein [Chitinophagaceae bacterium]
MSTVKVKNKSEYAKLIAKQRKEKLLKKEYYNSNAGHAALVMGGIFSEAKSLVKIYSGGFLGKFRKDPNT